jgi:hypothetical protein
MDTWPISLQQKLDVAGFQLRLGNTRIATDMDVGPAKIRSRFTDAVDGYDCQVLLDFTDIATFKTFYKTTLGNGTLPFLFVDPTTEVESVFRFVPGQDPIIRPIGGRVFQLSMSWELMP